MNTTPIDFIPRPQPKRRRRAVSSSLTLVSATYDAGASVTLKFDQPIDISQLNGPDIVVDDVLNSFTFVGMDGPATLVDPFTVRVDLEQEGVSTGSVTTLTASGATGIRAVFSGVEWPGVTAVPLPFP